jgi:hypothetical protein
MVLASEVTIQKFSIIKQVMPLKESIHITNLHIKYPRVMTTVKSGSLYFVRTHDIKTCNTHLEMKLR